MSNLYNITNSDDERTSIFFLTSLSPSQLQSIQEETMERYEEEKQNRIGIFFELMQKQDMQFQEITPEEFEI